MQSIDFRYPSKPVAPMSIFQKTDKDNTVFYPIYKIIFYNSV